MSSFVKQLGSGAPNPNGGTTGSFTLSAGMQSASNSIVVGWRIGGATQLVSVSDSRGNTYVINVQGSAGGGGSPCGIATCRSPTAALQAGDTITLHFNSGQVFGQVPTVVAEYVPLRSVHRTNTSSGTNSSVGTIGTSATTSTPTVAIGIMGVGGGAGSTWSVDSPFTKRFNDSFNSTTLLADEDLLGTGTPSATYRWSNGGTNWTAAMAVYTVDAPPSIRTAIQHAVARVQRIAVTTAQTSVAKIQRTFTKSQTATARVQQSTLTKTQTSVARVQNNAVQKSQTSTARIASTDIDLPYIAPNTHVYDLFSLFNPDQLYGSPGNGGERTLVRLAPNGVTHTATLAASTGVDAGNSMLLTGDSAFPTDKPFVVTIDSEQIYLSPTGGGTYLMRMRGMGNTTPAGHAAGATVSWGDSYDETIVADNAISHEFTADINSTGTTLYPGWLICFDSSQAYLSDGSRYPMHVSQLMGVFDAGAGISGSNRCDAAQPTAVHTPIGVSDDCPAALTNPSRIQADISVGDVAVLRYTNPEAVVLDLGPRSVACQSWFGLKRVDVSDNDVTFTDPNGYVVDTIPSGGGPGPFTGSVNGEWDPAPMAIGIAPAASDADPANAPIPTPTTVPWTTVTLPGSQRYFTDSIHFNEKGWPMCALAVRQGKRRVPFWQSWAWHNFNYVYCGFGTDDNYVQMLINRNGIVFDSVPEVELPGPQDIDGPDAVWDDGSYAFGASWYVVLFNTPYLVVGPSIGGTPPGSSNGSSAPSVIFPSPGTPDITVPTINPIEGGSGGNIGGAAGLHVWGSTGKGFF